MPSWPCIGCEVLVGSNADVDVGVPGGAGFTNVSPDEKPGARDGSRLTRPAGLVSSFGWSRPRCASSFPSDLWVVWAERKAAL